jgi:cytochrome b6-f complex iron-sulfur subunit
MERKEFIYLLGLGAASTALAACISGCNKDGSMSETEPANIDFTLDLTLPENASLNKNGSFLYRNSIIVARTLEGNFIAVSKTCSHEKHAVVYDGSNKQFFCPNHGSSFTENGSVSTGPALRPLRQYNTSLNGSLLRIYT